MAFEVEYFAKRAPAAGGAGAGAVEIPPGIAERIIGGPKEALKWVEECEAAGGWVQPILKISKLDFTKYGLVFLKCVQAYGRGPSAVYVKLPKEAIEKLKMAKKKSEVLRDILEKYAK